MYHDLTKLTVIGFGYVSFPFCLRFAEAGISVIGLDGNVDKTVKTNNGKKLYKSHKRRAYRVCLRNR